MACIRTPCPRACALVATTFALVLSASALAGEARVPIGLRGAHVAAKVEAVSREPAFRPVLRGGLSTPRETSVFGALREGLSHARRNVRGAYLLRGRDMHVDPNPDGDVHHDAEGTIAVGLRGNSASAGTVDASVRQALRGSYATRAARSAARAARARAHAAALGFLPRVTARLDLDNGPNTARPSKVKRQNVARMGIEASVPLFTSGVTLNTLRQAKSLARAADMNFLAAERKVALDAGLAHVELRLQRKVVAALRRHRDAVVKLVRVAHGLFRAGEVSRTDVAIARANAEGVAAELVEAERRLAEARTALESLTGRASPATLSLPNANVRLTLPRAVEEAVAHAPSLAARHLESDARAHGALAERGRHGPQVSAYAGIGRDVWHSTVDEHENGWEAGVRLSVPLFTPDAVGRVAAAKAEAVEARYAALDAERKLRERVAGLWHAHQAADRREAALKRQTGHVAITVRGTLSEYRAGFRSITDVLEAQVEALRARVALEGATHARAGAALRLAYATGRVPGATRHGDAR